MYYVKVKYLVDMNDYGTWKKEEIIEGILPDLPSSLVFIRYNLENREGSSASLFYFEKEEVYDE